MEVVDSNAGLKSSQVKTELPTKTGDIQASYDSSKVGNGWWRRGKNGDRLISEYQPYAGQGHASCENGNGTFSNGAWVGAYNWSKSSVGYTLFGGNKVYYNVR